MGNKTYKKHNQSSYGYGSEGFKKEKNSSESNGSSYQGRTRPKDPYEILGVSPGAGVEEIRNAYRQAVKTYHPDKVSHLGPEFQELAKEKFVEIQNAYEKLTGKEV
ncbi:MAG: J domain-containing protein [Deltaproteobacteria bacterium]|nr:J domain-containing protein [Deltaproteobacteria bacterium]